MFDANDRSSSSVAASCSRERSRDARAVLKEFFYPVTDAANYDLGPDCPLSRARDVFYEHETHKEPVRHSKNYWRSLYSGKVFKSEYYVDKHMERRHADKIPPGANVCLADYCDVLQCDRHASYVKGERERTDHCDVSHVEDTRELCKRMLTECFPHRGDRSDEKAKKLTAYFNKYYCEQMTCAKIGGVFELMSAHHETAGASYYILLGFVLLLVVTYYVSVYSWVNGRHVSLDVQRARRRARASWTDHLPRTLVKRLRLERKRKAS